MESKRIGEYTSYIGTFVFFYVMLQYRGLLLFAGAFGFNSILGVMIFFLCGTFVSNGLEILIHFFVSPFTESLQKVIWRVKNICSLESIIRYLKK